MRDIYLCKLKYTHSNFNLATYQKSVSDYDKKAEEELFLLKVVDLSINIAKNNRKNLYNYSSGALNGCYNTRWCYLISFSFITDFEIVICG